MWRIINGEKAIKVDEEIAGLDKQETSTVWTKEKRNQRAVLKHKFDEILRYVI